MAYLFLSYDEYETGGADPEDGEAVLLIQPGSRVAKFATIGPAGTKGRSLWRFGPEEAHVSVQFRSQTAAVPESVEHRLEEDGTVDVRDYLGG
ncbi:hypothetical protein ACFYXJ_06560 [Streptomyces sp. NPDC002667]|uniref:hypothetical protein n=1 Tax=Streptomyces sp. NPDC002667 TaxID=3364657 RepID=UPI0036B776FD